MRRVLASALVLVVSACAQLRSADSENDGGPSADDGGVTPESEGGAGGDASTSEGGTPPGPLHYDDVQKTLEAKRFPGPITAQGSKGACTPKRFYWKDSDGTLHSWTGATQARIDYAWKVPGSRPYFVPSDDLVWVDTPPADTTVDVYDATTTGTAGAPLASLPYAFNSVAANGAIVRLDQKVDGVALQGTKVRGWDRVTKNTTDITTVLPTTQPPSSFVNDTLVVPGSYPIPFPLYIVDTKGKTTKSVTFDGGIALNDTEQFEDGLLVSYVRNGAAGAALRVYKNDEDGAASRFELGDELANRANYFVDSTPLEHKFIARIATHGRRVFYSSVYGIWSYDFASGTFAPVQLVAGQKTGVPDIMCVLRDEGLLMYRLTNDAVGQIWAVPLSSIFP